MEDHDLWFALSLLCRPVFRSPLTPQVVKSGILPVKTDVLLNEQPELPIVNMPSKCKPCFVSDDEILEEIWLPGLFVQKRSFH